MKVKKRRLKKQAYFIFIGLIIFILIIIFGIKRIQYMSSNEYKLGKLGYDEKQVEVLLKLDEDNIKDILSRDFNKTIVSFAKQKYFMYKNLDRYLKYYKKNKDVKFGTIVSLVNVGADFEWYDEDNIKDTDLSKKELMLVNKFYHLNKDFVPEEIMDIPSTYAYADNQASKETFEAFKKMWNDAKKKDLTLIVGSSYRPYETQEELWSSYAASHDEEWADSYAARAGYSEHQTGLALDIVTYNSTMDDFEQSDEFKWLDKNAYKYGFILRYPKGKDNITGYAYESWHYRYVGVEAAKKIHDEGITFDEYYAYYIDR